MKRDMSIIHPDLRRVAGVMIQTTVTKRNLWFMRRSFNAIAFLFLSSRKPLPDVHIENVRIPSGDVRTSIRLRIYHPKAQSNAGRPVLVWLHGGGYVQGKPEVSDKPCIEYVRKAGISVVSVDYRYAPEYPFPAGLEDAYAALKWIVSNARRLRIDPFRIGIGGESAGGGLAAALVQLAVDRKEIAPVFQLLVYPMLDDRTCLRTDVNGWGHFIWNMGSNRFGWESYIGTRAGAPDLPEYAVPARRGDLSGLPPAWVGVGTVDLFHDEDVAYAKKLKDCGVECLLNIFPGTFHGFDGLVPKAAVTRAFRESQIAAIKKYLCKE
jgi:acetyl esterase/lipase